jgi:hypothetical protein
VRQLKAMRLIMLSQYLYPCCFFHTYLRWCLELLSRISMHKMHFQEKLKCLVEILKNANAFFRMHSQLRGSKHSLRKVCAKCFHLIQKLQ